MPITRVYTINPTTGRIEVNCTGSYGPSGGGVDPQDLADAVDAAFADLVDGAPGSLDTLNELAAALGDDANYAATITTALAGKQPIDSDLTAIAALTTTSTGRSLLAAADAAAIRTIAGSQVAGSYQTLDSDLTAIAALSTTSFGRSLLELADAAAVRTAIAKSPATTTDPGGTLTVNSDTTEQSSCTALSQATTIAAPTGTPVDGQRLIIRLKDNGTARALTWNAAFTIVGVTLPTTTVLGKKHYVACRWNASTTTWDVLAVSVEQ